MLLPGGPCRASSNLPGNVSVVKIACWLPRHGAQKHSGEQPGDVKMECGFNPATFCRTAPSKGNGQLHHARVRQSQPNAWTNPLLTRRVRGCRREPPALSSRQHCAPVPGLSPHKAKTAVGFAERKSTHEAP